MIHQHFHIFKGNYFIQAGKYMHSITFLAHFFPSVELPQNQQDLWRKCTGHKNVVSFLSTIFSVINM
jgi:hypothetical protein